MLYEYRDIYMNHARLYDGWNTKSKNDLCYEYCSEDKNIDRELCLSAIIYRFWSLPMKAYYTQQQIIATENDCYNWLITSVLAVLNSRPWENKKSTLYNDENAPEKAINVCFSNEKINFFVSCQRERRKLNYTSLSLEGIQEGCSDSFFTKGKSIDVVRKVSLKELVLKYFKRDQYIVSFIMDSIMNMNFIKTDNYGIRFDLVALKKHLRTLPEKYCIEFSKEYSIDLEEVKKAANDIRSLKYDKLNCLVKRTLDTFSRDKELLEILC